MGILGLEKWSSTVPWNGRRKKNKSEAYFDIDFWDTAMELRRAMMWWEKQGAMSVFKVPAGYLRTKGLRMSWANSILPTSLKETNDMNYCHAYHETTSLLLELHLPSEQGASGRTSKYQSLLWKGEKQLQHVDYTSHGKEDHNRLLSKMASGN